MDIAIIGMSCRLPGGANDTSGFWSMLAEGRNASSKIPKDRFNAEAFYHPDPEVNGMMNTQHGHFLSGDLSKFDSNFFSIPPTEADTIDPQQRILLESVYEGLENAGLPLENVAGTKTAVFAALFSRDYLSMLAKDTIDMGKYHMTGIGDAILANRVSYVFDLKGPSITLDTGCSGSLVAIHMACQSLRTRESSLAIASGVNLILHPDQMIPMSLMHILNREGKCFAFDSRGEGYGRGEGVGTVILKRLDDAIRDGDNIRAVVRGSGVNSDGKTNGIALPNQVAQEELARDVYLTAGLDPLQTAYCEAHGTGTAAGDAIETQAIATVFTGERRSVPLTIGSAKGNVGHLESASGIAGVLKAVLALEMEQIPPQLNLKEFKKNLRLREHNIRVPMVLEDWPAGLPRRASVNSFGYGGTNGHLILERFSSSNNFLSGHRGRRYGLNSAVVHEIDVKEPRLISLSARSEFSLAQMAMNLAQWLEEQDPQEAALDDLSYTLNCRRSLLQWRFITLVSSRKQLIDVLRKKPLMTTQASSNPRKVFLFTGQGAQWFGMGRDLLRHPVFAASLSRSTKQLYLLGATWNLIRELSKDESESRVHESEIGQPCTTSIQIALTDYLESIGIRPHTVLGHSSGEIAAAYAAGALTHETAIAISYNRSFLSKNSRDRVGQAGTMAVVGLSEQEAATAIAQLERGHASIACLNDPQSTTISGDKAAVDEMLDNLDPSIFSKRLKVDTAYHSHHMEAVAVDYLHSMHGLKAKQKYQSVQFISSVTATPKFDGFGPEYWVENLVSTVRFSEALQKLCLEHSSRSYVFIEIGPHSALAGPCKRTTQSLNVNRLTFSYVPSLIRGRSASLTILELVAKLFEAGIAVDLKAATLKDNASPKMLSNLPSYAWDKRQSYWHESRLSREHRLRLHAPHDLLGTRVAGSDPQEPSWRMFISDASHPWLKDHVVDGLTTFPGTGYVAMAIEAVCQLQIDFDRKQPSQIRLRNIDFVKTLIVPESPAKVEVHMKVYRPRNAGDRTSTGWYGFRISSIADGRTWSDHCSGEAMLELDASDSTDEVRSLEDVPESRKSFESTRTQCIEDYDSVKLYGDLASCGNRYGATFAVLKSVSTGVSSATGTIVTPDVASIMPSGFQSSHVIHPATIDAMLHIHIPLFMRNGGHGSVVPTRIDSVSISARVSKNPGDELYCSGRLAYHDARNATAATIAFQHDANGQLIPVISIVGGELKGIGEQQRLDAEDKIDDHVCHYQYFPLVDFIPSKKMESSAINLLQRNTGLLGLEEKEILLTEVMTWYIDQAVREIRIRGLCVPETYEKWYYAWMKKYNASKESQNILVSLTPERLDAHTDVIKQLGVEGEALTQLGTSLVGIVTAQTSSLEILLQDDLYFRLYSSDPSLKCAKYLSKYIKHLYHDKGPLKVLEIGAGTGATTKSLFADVPREAFRLYDFTDISTGFFEQAQETFGKVSDIMRFKKFDVEQSPKNQGFLEPYDLVVAANVLHATRSLSVTLSNVRALLKPGARLALIEVTRVTPAYNATFGATAGWWNGVEDGREDTPLLSIDKWHDRLTESSFSGVDIALKDSDTPAWMSALMISRKPYSASECPAVRVISSPHLDIKGHDWALQLMDALREKNCNVSSERLGTSIDGSSVYIMLDSANKPLLFQPSSEVFDSVKAIVSQGRRVFWITMPEGTQSVRSKAFITGFARSARSEYPELKMITMEVRLNVATGGTKLLGIITELFHQAFCWERQNDEAQNFEYVLEDDTVLVPRIVPNKKLNSISRTREGFEAVEAPFHQVDRPVRLHVETPGLLDSIIFIDDDSAQTPLPPHQLEVQVMACGVNFKDVFIALGQMKATTRMVGECAGIVTAVGEDWETEFKVGDRCVCYNGTPYASRTRVSGYATQMIPDSISFEDAAAIPIIFATAHYSLVNLAKLQAGETVLIHAAAGGVGQAAIIIAQHIGATVFATVGSDSKRRLLIERYGLKDYHIFSSRDRNFKPGILRMTNGKGVNAVLNSLSGEMLHDSWACVGKFGTFIEIGKADIYQKSLVSMEPFDRNVAFASVDLVAIADFRPRVMKAILSEVMERLTDGRYKAVHPVTVMEIARIEDAFRLIQSRKHTGKLVLRCGPDSAVKSTLPKVPELCLDAQATYVIAGGLGSVGTMLIRFMASRGGKNFVALTRRTLSPQERDQIDAKFAEGGIKVTAETCDISSMISVDSMVSRISTTMAPVKGIIQAAVVLSDRVLETMTRDEWEVPLKIKYTGTKNLVDGFRHLKPDFFLCMSSCASIPGTRGQANYNAGNAYQDSLSHEINDQGTHFTSLNLSLVLESEVAGHQESVQSLLRQGCVPVKKSEFLSLCGYMMSPDAFKYQHRQVTMGFTRASLSGKDDLFTLRSALFNLLPFSNEPTQDSGGPSVKIMDIPERLASATSVDEARTIISEALTKKMAALVARNDLTVDTAIVELGVDSLIAIELKNWLNRVLKAPVRTVEILESPTLRSLAYIVADKTTLFQVERLSTDSNAMTQMNGIEGRGSPTMKVFSEDGLA